MEHHLDESVRSNIWSRDCVMNPAAEHGGLCVCLGGWVFLTLETEDPHDQHRVRGCSAPGLGGGPPGCPPSG